MGTSHIFLPQQLFLLLVNILILSQEVLSEIISDPVCKDMLIDIGMGARHRNVRYNCRIICSYKKVYIIRPNKSLANDGLHREARLFLLGKRPAN